MFAYFVEKKNVVHFLFMIVSSEISHNKKNMPWLFLSSSEVLLCLHYKLASMVSIQEMKYLYYDLKSGWTDCAVYAN
jgi:hypothetical protein